MGILSLFPCSFADGSNLLLYFNATIISRLFVLFIGVFQTRFLCISKRRCLRSLLSLFLHYLYLPSHYHIAHVFFFYLRNCLRILCLLAHC
jgi:hypothetical protein